jgi:probable HAF family extracellular repeat protein
MPSYGKPRVTGNGAQHAFQWVSGTITDLGTLGGTHSYASGINDSGQVVGYSDLTGNTTQHAFSVRAGGPMVDVGAAGGTFGVGNAVNNAGQIVGHFTAASSTHAAIWSGPWKDLVGNFGLPPTIWALRQTAWIQVNGKLGAKTIVSGDFDGNGLDDLAIDFSFPYGVWLWMNHATWVHSPVVAPPKALMSVGTQVCAAAWSGTSHSAPTSRP